MITFIDGFPMTNALRDVLAERERQRQQWGNDHDDKEESDGQLADAAAVLAVTPESEVRAKGVEWVWGLRSRLIGDVRGRLVRAAALLLAELERLDRLK